MSVKVRCPGCEKVLNVPDKAMGKAVRCPKCETKVKVPIRKQKKPARKPQESTEAFLGLNLREAEDRHARICPICGINTDSEDTMCPGCGVDLATGQVPEAEMKRRRLKGPDPALYYKDAWVGSWDFMRKNKKLGFRTFVYWLVLVLMYTGASYMVGYCASLPPKGFWFFIGLLSFLAYPGWLWSLMTRIVWATAGKKKLGRVNFDLFLNIAFGVKLILWWFAFSLPATIIAVPFLFIHPIAAAVVSGLGTLAILCMVPIAMGHMSMPVTWKAWISPMLIPVMFRHLGHSLWWLLILLTVLVICYIPVVAAVIGCFGIIVAAINEGTPPGMTPLIILLSGSVVSNLMLSFGALFVMRATGLYVYYNKRTLELVTLMSEKVYVPKTALPLGEKPPMHIGQAAGMVGIFAILGLAGGSVYSVVGGRDVSFFYAAGCGMIGTGALVGFWGRSMVSKLAWKESHGWGWAVWGLPFADFVFMTKHFEKVMLPMAVQYSSLFFYILGWGLMFFGSPSEQAPPPG